jgi:replication factor C subunit 2/4
LSISGTRSKLTEISTLESIKISDEVLDSLIAISAGDLRRSITFLQSASKLSNSNEILEQDIQEIGGMVPQQLMKQLLESTGIEVRETAVGGGDEDIEMSGVDQKKGRQKTQFEKVQEVVESVLREGYSAVQIINQVLVELCPRSELWQFCLALTPIYLLLSLPPRVVSASPSAPSPIVKLHDLILLDPLIPSKPKALISIALGEADKCLNDGADEGLQILAVCLKISKAINQI